MLIIIISVVIISFLNFYTTNSFIFKSQFLNKVKFLRSISNNELYKNDMTVSTTISKKPSIKVKIADSIISSVFKIRPLFKIASKKARSSMTNRGLKIGVDWSANVAQLESDKENLMKIYDSLNSDELLYPDYYLQPFHAYDEGNLSWQAAMEVESAALTVHSQIYTKSKDELDKNGDFTLRDNFHKNMLKVFQRKNFIPKSIIDIGCSTGLSTVKFHESFPNAEITGVDLSAYMLSIAKYQLQNDEKLKSAKQYIKYMHSLGEDTRLGKGDVNLVSVSLVSHELPESASREIIREAYNILPTGLFIFNIVVISFEIIKK
jgi:SAM-dependent methyltransferase